MDNNRFKNENDNAEDIGTEALNDNKNFENCEKSKKDYQPLDQEKAYDNASKEEGAEQEAENYRSTQENAYQGTQDGNIEDQKKYSASYEPPYYIPNFTVVETLETSAKKEKKEKRKYSIGVISIICAVCVLISVTLGAIAGAIAGGRVDFEVAANNDEIVNIVRSDREIKVNEITGNTGYSDLDVSQVYKLVGNSVVEITTKQMQTSYYGQYITSGAGSGVIFSRAGNDAYIVTNYHVIENADDITVRVKNNTSYKDYNAEYLSGDKSGDIAVLKISGSGEEFTTAVFGDSDKLIVGEEVVAIGNPLGSLGGTVTNGIISALDREITIEDNVMTLLQTNAAINPGNSGGGLFNMAGELIGIVNAKQSSTGIEGLGFAIPSNRVANDIKDILEIGYVTGRATLGIAVQEAQNGVFVTVPGNSGLLKNDKIVQIGEYTIATMSDYNNALKKLTIGTAVTVRVERSNGYWGNGYVDVSIVVSENKSKY